MRKRTKKTDTKETPQTPKTPKFYTLADVSRLLGVSYNRLYYVTLAVDEFRPTREYGSARLFSAAQVEKMRIFFTD